MGKGFNNYMCKKFFHPASRDNLKRVWMAEQKAESYKKKQEELRVQYEKEQDLYTNKAMLSKESKDKLSVNFMYEPPPGTKKEREREDDEPEYKFEWQRKFNAPREDYCKGDSEIRDQPFGIQVRNVRCIKCHKWGHINTDKECPMYNQSSSTDQTGCSMDPLLLVQQMREDGLAMKQSALGLHLAGTEHMPESDEDNGKLKESEIELLKSLSKKQKQKLLKKFKKLERSAKKKKKKAKKTSKRDSREDSEDRKRHKSKHRKKDKESKNKIIKREKYSSSSESDSDSSESSKDIHESNEKFLKEELRRTKVMKRDKSSDSSSDSGLESNGRTAENGKRHTKLSSQEEVLRRTIKKERSSSSEGNSKHDHQRKEHSRSHSDRKHHKVDSMAELEQKLILENGSRDLKKYREEYDSDCSSNDKRRKRKTSESLDAKEYKTREGSGGKNRKKRQSSDSSSDEKYRSKMPRLDLVNNKHKKLSSEELKKRFNSRDRSTSYEHR